ncbi:hypothetical protein [Actinomyces ruminicola]|uniref:ABC-2 type transport system permease protein n=1 Tax=Actinomyces ruminicola TaxID=332524 RepID=A0A1G9RR76_9ACTO|nr:hypothetical protein [Actinomyces ruminicola]SDM25664.1 hypothetical protein SAMN04487766_101108 [Actinomyces ruminicola]
MTVVRAEMLKAATIPALRWTAALTAIVSVLLLAVLRRDAPSTGSVSAEAVAAGMWTWVGLIQTGFLAAGILVSTKEHTSALGRTTLLVEPRRQAVWAARLTVLVGASLPAAAALAATALLALDTDPGRASAEAAARTGVWLVAVAVIAAGVGAALRRVLGATSLLLLLVVVAPAVTQNLGQWARWLPGAAAQDWVREGAWSDGAVVLAWAMVAAVAGAARLALSDA